MSATPSPYEVFGDRFFQHMDLLDLAPPDQGVPQEVAVASLVALEEAAMSAVVSDKKLVRTTLGEMTLAVTKTLEANVQPPFTQEQKSAYMGKIATYKMLSESAPPSKKNLYKRTRPTDTNAIPTDKPKG